MRPTSFSLKFASTHALVLWTRLTMPTPMHGHLADLQLVGILDHAIHRRADVGTRKVEPRLVDRRLGLRDLRLLARRDRGAGVGGASARIGQLRFGRSHLVERVLIVGLAS